MGYLTELVWDLKIEYIVILQVYNAIINAVKSVSIVYYIERIMYYYKK